MWCRSLRSRIAGSAIRSRYWKLNGHNMRTIVETLRPDVPYHVRQRLGPEITRFGQTLGQPQDPLRDTEYVSTVQQPLDRFTEILQKHGFK